MAVMNARPRTSKFPTRAESRPSGPGPDEGYDRPKRYALPSDPEWYQTYVELKRKPVSHHRGPSERLDPRTVRVVCALPTRSHGGAARDRRAGARMPLPTECLPRRRAYQATKGTT